MGCGKVGIMNRVGNLQILGYWVLLIIIAALPVQMLAAPTAAPAAATPAAPKNATPPKASAATPAKAPASMPAPSEGQKPEPPAPAKKADPPSSLVQLRLEPLKQIYSKREGVVVQFVFTAKTKTKLCLAKDILSQMQVSMYRSGQGKLALKPLVIQDNSQLFMEPMRVVWLDSGQSLTVRANLKRFQFDGGSVWEPGEYGADATFSLCEQIPAEPVTDPGHEIPVKSARQGWFMIME